MTQISPSELARIHGGSFLSPTCEEAQRSAAFYRNLGDDVQGHLERRPAPWGFGWWAKSDVSQLQLQAQLANRRVDRLCGANR